MRARAPAISPSLFIKSQAMEESCRDQVAIGNGERNEV